jgi:chorismate mutase
MKMKDLEALRANIDQLDQQLWDIISQRVEVAREIGEWKHAHGEPVIHPERYEQVLQHCLEQGKQHGLSEQLVREVMEALHKESVRVES